MGSQHRINEGSPPTGTLRVSLVGSERMNLGERDGECVRASPLGHASCLHSGAQCLQQIVFKWESKTIFLLALSNYHQRLYFVIWTMELFFVLYVYIIF